MARAQRRVSRAFERVVGGAGAIHALLVLLSFLLGAVLDWVRHQPYSFTWSWRMETFMILVAAWICVSLMARWPRHEKYVGRTAGLLLLMMFLGSLLIHQLLDHP
jgi:uncharacterized membrane protein